MKRRKQGISYAQALEFVEYFTPFGAYYDSGWAKKHGISEDDIEWESFEEKNPTPYFMPQADLVCTHAEVFIAQHLLELVLVHKDEPVEQLVEVIKHSKDCFQSLTAEAVDMIYSYSPVNVQLLPGHFRFPSEYRRTIECALQLWIENISHAIFQSVQSSDVITKEHVLKVLEKTNFLFNDAPVATWIEVIKDQMYNPYFGGLYLNFKWNDFIN